MKNKRVLDIAITGKDGQIDNIFGYLHRFYGRVNRPSVRTSLNSTNEITIESHKLEDKTYAVNFNNAQIKDDCISHWRMGKIETEKLKNATCVTLPLMINGGSLDTNHKSDYEAALKWVCEKNFYGKIRINVHGSPGGSIGMCQESLKDAGHKVAEWLLNCGLCKLEKGLTTINWNACWTANTFPRIPPAYNLDKKCFAPDENSILDKMLTTLTHKNLSGLNITGAFTTTYTDYAGTGKMGGFFSIPKLDNKFVKTEVFGQTAQIEMPKVDLIDDNGYQCVLWYTLQEEPKISQESVEFKLLTGTLSLNRNEWAFSYNEQTKKLGLYAPQGWNKSSNQGGAGNIKLQLTAKDLFKGDKSITYRIAGSKTKVEVEVLI